MSARRARAAPLLLALAAVFSLAPPAPGAPPTADDLYARAERLCIDDRREESLPISLECLDATRREGNRHLEAWALDLIGNNYFGLDRPAEALACFEASLAVMRETGDRYGEATALKDAGVTCRVVGRFDDGIAYLFQSLEIARALDDPGKLVSTLANLGQAYANIGATRFAQDAYREAIAIAEARCRDTELVADLEVRTGWLLIDRDDPSGALAHFRRALEVCEVRPDTELLLDWARMGVSESLFELGDVDSAIALRLESLELNRRKLKTTSEGAILLSLARYVEARDPELAMRYCHEALDLFGRQNAIDAWYACRLLAEQYRRRGDLDRAVEYYRRAVDGIESVRGQLASGSLRATFYGTNQAFYQGLIETLIERGDDAQAFAVFERAKSRAMLDAITEARVDADAELAPDLRDRREKLNSRVAELQERLGAEGASTEERTSALAQLGEAEAQLDVLVAEIKRENPRYAAIRYPEPLSLENARALLGDDTALLAFSATKEHVTAFLVTADAFEAVRLAEPPDVLAERVRNYVDLLAEDGDGWRDIGRRLYAAVVAPLRGRIGPRVARLVVVPDGALHELPFETLPVEGGEGAPFRFLLEDFAVSYAPSATVLSELSAPGWVDDAPDQADVAVFADPAAGSGAPESAPGRLVRALYEDEHLDISPVPSTLVEANAIARYVRSGSAIFTGADATERRVKEGGLDRYRVLHFATHGIVSERAPYRSALVLARGEGDGEDGFLQAREIYGLRLRTDLVVLSACQTARGSVLEGEGVQSLAVAFLHAGARSVVASLWNVNDERTATFMETFYRHLSAGKPKADALRATKLELIADPDTASPRVWAPFVLVGEGSRPVQIGEPPSPARWGWALAVVVVALAALWFLRSIRVDPRHPRHLW